MTNFPTTTDCDLMKDFYVNGFHYGSFSNQSSLSRVLELFKSLEKNPPKEPYSWLTKFENSHELIPHESVWNYDSSLLDILFENSLPDIIKQLTGVNLYLVRVQIRQFNKGKSYTGVHRDTYDMGTSWKGHTPPCVKVLFAPRLDDPSVDTFRVVPQSHRKMLSNEKFDRLKLKFSKKNYFKSSNKNFAIFRGDVGHGALDNPGPYCFRRLIYSFVQESQLKNEESHELIDLYKNRLSE